MDSATANPIRETWAAGAPRTRGFGPGYRGERSTGEGKPMNCPHCGKALAIVKAEVPAPPAPASPPPDHWEPVRSTVTCNRCGDSEVAWLKGRNGKAYLAVARRLQDGRLGCDRREFHECPGDWNRP